MSQLLKSTVVRLVVLTLFASTSLVLARPINGAIEHWVAISNTAISITGNVRFDGSSMRFANGASIGLRYMGTRPLGKQTVNVHGNAREYDVYGVTGGVNPMLLNRNKLCAQLPTYALVAYSPEIEPQRTMVFATFFTGKVAPQWDSKGLCAAFTYEFR